MTKTPNTPKRVDAEGEPVGPERAPTRSAPGLLPRLACVAAVLLPAATALAQEAERLRPPIPSDQGDPPAILTIIGGGILAAILLFAAAFPSKRGHQD